MRGVVLVVVLIVCALFCGALVFCRHVQYDSTLSFASLCVPSSVSAQALDDALCYNVISHINVSKCLTMITVVDS